MASAHILETGTSPGGSAPAKPLARPPTQLTPGGQNTPISGAKSLDDTHMALCGTISLGMSARVRLTSTAAGGRPGRLDREYPRSIPGDLPIGHTAGTPASRRELRRRGHLGSVRHVRHLHGSDRYGRRRCSLARWDGSWVISRCWIPSC
jgi:hypothetical protein